MKRVGFTNRSRLTGASFLALATMLVLSFAVSCAPPGLPPAGTAGAPGKYDHLDADDKVAMSDLLTDDAEEKIALPTMNEAWGGFAEALQVNPANHRAAFWYELLKPMLEMKGLLARVRPLYMKQEFGAERYMALMKSAEHADPQWTKFITNGPNDLDTDEKVREWLDRQIVAFDSLRIFLKANKDRTISIRSPVALFRWSDSQAPQDKCAALTFMAGTFGGCPERGMIGFKLNRADFEVLQYLAGAQMIQLAMLYAYNLNPLGIYENATGKMTFKEKVEFVTKGYDGGLLAKNRLGLANFAIEDAVAARRYFILNQDELCKQGPGKKNNRPGFLFFRGFCFESPNGTDEKRVLQMLETLIAGQPVEVDVAFTSTPVKVYVKKFFNEPPGSAFLIAPTSYSSSGEALSVNEAAYSAYFATGTANDVLRALELQRKINRENAERAAMERAAEDLRFQQAAHPALPPTPSPEINTQDRR